MYSNSENDKANYSFDNQPENLNQTSQTQEPQTTSTEPMQSDYRPVQENQLHQDAEPAASQQTQDSYQNPKYYYTSQYGQYGQQTSYGTSSQYGQQNVRQAPQYGQYGQYAQHNPYASYNTYKQPGSSTETSDTGTEMKKFKKTMYRLLAGICVLALVIGIVGGGVAGYTIAGGFSPKNEVSTSAGTTTGGPNMQAPLPGTTAATSDAAAAKPSIPDEKPNFVMTPVDNDALPVQEIYASSVDSVVSIFVETTVNSGYYYYGQEQSFTRESSGSGVIISEDGYIATNNHVIENASKIRVCLQDGREFEAVLVGTDSDTDVALIKIEADNLSAAPIGDSDSVVVGDQAFVIGNPLGKLSGSLAVGYVSALNRPLTIDSVSGKTLNVIQTDAAVNPGNSGGALFNAKGELVGIVFAKTSDTDVEGLGYAIPINKAIAVINDLVDYGYVKGRPAFGISVVTVTSAYEAMMYRVNYLGVYIASANPQSGFQSGDLIVSVNGTEIGDYLSLATAISQMQVGDTATVEIMRNNEKMTLEVPVIESVPTAVSSEQ